MAAAPKLTEEERRELREREREAREDARNFIWDSVCAGVPAEQILDDLATFFDGDIVDLL